MARFQADPCYVASFNHSLQRIAKRGTGSIVKPTAPAHRENGSNERMGSCVDGIGMKYGRSGSRNPHESGTVGESASGRLPPSSLVRHPQGPALSISRDASVQSLRIEASPRCQHSPNSQRSQIYVSSSAIEASGTQRGRQHRVPAQYAS